LITSNGILKHQATKSLNLKYIEIEKLIIKFCFVSKEREEWVQAIEQQILSSLQTNETNKLKVYIHFYII
jgi:hypothetical protein